MARVCDRCRESMKENESAFTLNVVLPPVDMCEPPSVIGVTFSVAPDTDNHDTCANCALDAFQVAFDHLLEVYGGICASCHDRGRVGVACTRCKECNYIPLGSKESHGNKEETPTARAQADGDDGTGEALGDNTDREESSRAAQERTRPY